MRTQRIKLKARQDLYQILKKIKAPTREEIVARTILQEELKERIMFNNHFSVVRKLIG